MSSLQTKGRQLPRRQVSLNAQLLARVESGDEEFQECFVHSQGLPLSLNEM